MPRPHYKMMAGVCPFVCLSRALTELEKKGLGSPKIGKMEAHHMGNQWTRDHKVYKSSIQGRLILSHTM